MPVPRLVVVGASAGGVEALCRLLWLLPADLPAAVLVVMHVAPAMPSVLYRILARAGALPVEEAVDGMPIERGRVYVAPGDQHLLVDGECLALMRGPRENGHRPALDPLFRSAAREHGPRVAGVVLSGNLSDGTHGLAQVAEHGGLTLVQDPQEALFDGMPRSAIARVRVDAVLPLVGLAAAIERFARTGAPPAADAEVSIGRVRDETNGAGKGQVLSTEALRSVSASVAFAARLVGDAQTGQLVLDGAVHLAPDVYAAHELTAVDSAHPLAAAVRTGRVIACTNERDILAEYPRMRDMIEATGARAMCVVPVQQYGEMRGAFALLFPEPREFSVSERAQLRALGARYARALHHARLYFSERDARMQAERAQRDAERARQDAESSRVVLMAMHAELESRIVERTNELAQLNNALTGEIVERTRAEEERNALRRQLISAEEEERRRIARELHDQLGQHLTALALGLDEVSKSLPHDAVAQRRLSMLQELTVAMTRDARHLALELRPPELDDVGLESALQTYLAQWSQRFNIAVDIEVTGLVDRRLPSEAGTTLYRVVQEALTNVAKHARARHASVLVECADGEVRLVVEDDGRGFDVELTMQRAANERRLGLAGMRERAELVGGTLAVESSPGTGAALYVRLPLERSQSGVDELRMPLG